MAKKRDPYAEVAKLFSCGPTRFSSTRLNICSIPRVVGACPTLFADYGQLERHLVVTSFPGLDGIGADVSYQKLERVIYDDTHYARVIKSLPNGQVEVAFEDRNLIPPVMKVPSSRLQWALEDGTFIPFTNVALRCPKCDVEWQEKPGFRFNFFDCPVCGMRKEDACSWRR